MRWTPIALLTKALEADGEGVWSWHRGAGAKFALRRAGDGGKKARSRGEHAISRKTIARGMPGDSGVT